MKHLQNVSAQQVSWVKSDKDRLERVLGIENLYYPETTEELKNLVLSFQESNEDFDLIGFSSNTLFLPSYKVKHLICTKYLQQYSEDEHYINCDCGVSVSVLSRMAVEKGYKGFEGLCDLPGTIASGVYGNCGCFGCSVLSLVESFTFLTDQGEEKELKVDDLKPTFRSTSLKRKELSGVILKVKLRKTFGDIQEVKTLADKAHQTRKNNQPSGANNLGSTFNGGNQSTIKGLLFKSLIRLQKMLHPSKQQRELLPAVMSVYGQSKFAPYLWNWGRWMFLDEKAHDLFPEYVVFLKSLFKDIRLEIEIKR